MKSEIAILIWLTQGFQKCKVFEFSTIGLRAKAKNVWKSSALLCSAPISRQGRAFGLLVPATYYKLTKFQLSRPYGLGCTFSFRK